MTQIVSQLIFILAGVLLGIGFIALGVKSAAKNCRTPYIFWGASFFFLGGWDVFDIMRSREIISPDAALYLAHLSWLVFLILLYFGTIYIFTKRIFVGLTYILLVPAVLTALLIIFLPSQTTLIALASGFVVFIPFQLVLGILSWFLGISVFRDLPRLFTYWTMGAAFFLFSVESAAISISPIFHNDLSQTAFDAGNTSYLGVIGEILLILAFFSLLFHSMKQKKECF